MTAPAIRALGPEDDGIIVAHHRAIWDSYGTPAEDYLPDADERVRAFLVRGRAEAELAAFAAEVDGAVAGSVACLLYPERSPNILRPEKRLLGYICHVFTAEPFRRRGIGRALVLRAVEHLSAIGCTRALLNASDAGMPLYLGLGFERSNEMRMGL